MEKLNSGLIPSSPKLIIGIIIFVIILVTAVYSVWHIYEGTEILPSSGKERTIEAIVKANDLPP